MPVEMLAQVRIPNASAIPEDTLVNDWAVRIETSPPPAATMNAVASALQTFYNAIAGMCSYNQYASVYDVVFYNRADPTPRAPVKTVSNTWTGLVGTGSLPAENSVCLSFQGAKISGASQARRRGRIYLPALTTGTLTTAGQLSTGTCTTIQAAATALLAASDAAADWSWVVWSRMNAASVPVANGWVDNAMDTQRRRGRGPTARYLIPTP